MIISIYDQKSDQLELRKNILCFRTYIECLKEVLSITYSWEQKTNGKKVAYYSMSSPGR